MRPFPLIVALLSAATMIPGSAFANECTSNQPSQRFCVEHTVDAPNNIPSQLYPVVGQIEHRYYVYFGTAECTASPISRACTGSGEGPGMTFGTYGIVYYESNGRTGLQRHQAAGTGGPVPADTMVLV